MMFKLFDLGNDQYRVDVSRFGTRSGSLRDVVQFLVFDLDISYKEIERALLVMNELGHDGADFGVLGCFIYSFSTKENKRVG